MKNFCLTAFIFFGIHALALAKTQKYEGIESEMPSDTFERAGLRKLTPTERAVLDEYIANLVAAKQKVAAEVASAQAVDRAVAERKVQPPEIIESRIIGSYSGYKLRTVFHLENGQTWRPTNSDLLTVSPIPSPKVVIYKDVFGYKMWIEGESAVRVKRID